ncbi:Uncharacterised protein [uncultured archaeon]|nr:Uncharacterised protein [uncultured archaeon]
MLSAASSSSVMLFLALPVFRKIICATIAGIFFGAKTDSLIAMPSSANVCTAVSFSRANSTIFSGESHVSFTLNAKYSKNLYGRIQMPHHFVLKPVSAYLWMNARFPEIV